MKRSSAKINIWFTPPMECAPVSRVPKGPGWVYELKLDGFRGQAIRDHAALASIHAPCRAHSLGLDGELGAFDQKGQPSFAAMQDADSNMNVVFFVFDVLWHRGEDARQLPLSERLDILESAFLPSDLVQHAEHFTGPAEKFLIAVRKIGGEAVIAKSLNSKYEPGKRSGAWSKMRLNVGRSSLSVDSLRAVTGSMR